jgi:hypothetical protein
MDASVGDGVLVERLGIEEAKHARRRRLAREIARRIVVDFIVTAP